MIVRYLVIPRNLTNSNTKVLENHHASYTFGILKKEKSNIFKELSKDDHKIIRKLIVSCILATDMAVHGQTTKAMQQLQEKVKIPATLSKRTNDFSDYRKYFPKKKRRVN